MAGSFDVSAYQCLREKVANLKLEQRQKVCRKAVPEESPQEGARIDQLNLPSQQIAKLWEGRLVDATRRLGRQRAEADKAKQAAATRINGLVAKLEQLERAHKEVALELEVSHQKQLDDLAEQQQKAREAWRCRQEELDNAHRLELDDKLKLVKEKSLAACKEVLQSEEEWKRRHAVLLEASNTQKGQLHAAQKAVEELTGKLDEALQGQTDWKVQYETAAVKHHRQTAGLQQHLQEAGHALAAATAAHQADVIQLRAAHKAELETYRIQKSRDLVDVESRIRDTINRKDDTIYALQRDLDTGNKRLTNLEGLLRQLHDENAFHV